MPNIVAFPSSYLPIFGNRANVQTGRRGVRGRRSPASNAPAAATISTRRVQVMRKILLGSTALLGFVLLSASAAAPVELSISGNVRLQGAYVDADDDDGAESDYDLSQTAERTFNHKELAQ